MTPENNAPVNSGAHRREIEHFVAPLEETPLQVTDKVNEEGAPSSMWREAWRNLRTQPLFYVAGLLLLLVILVSLFPGVFSPINPTAGEKCDLNFSNGGPVAGHPLGFTQQGCDVYARVIYGAQASVTVGLLTTIAVVLIGGIIGAIAGYYGGWVDAVLARINDIFFALPMILGAIVIMQVPAFRGNRSVWTLIVVLTIFGWPQIARITRAAVIEVRNADFIKAATSLGVSRFGSLVRHVIPNSLAPVIVIATISLGTFIVAESTLSFLGIGLPPSTMSWGNDIQSAQSSLRSNPWPLLWPSIGLSITVLSFMMLGDALRDALDPKARKK